MGNYDNRRNRRKLVRKPKKSNKKNKCYNKFEQELIVDFNVVFEVEIVDIDVIDVTLTDAAR